MAHIITAANFGKLLRAMIAALDRFAPLMSLARVDVAILGSMLPGPGFHNGLVLLSSRRGLKAITLSCVATVAGVSALRTLAAFFLVGVLLIFLRARSIIACKRRSISR
jgi:hypothetical protein